MNGDYEELLDGKTVNRLTPPPRHEEICTRLHERVGASLALSPASRLLPRRTGIDLSRRLRIHPDLALVTVATGKLWLAAEIINSGDHSADTFIKKQFYEQLGLARLWMIDPRYDNVEVYHGSQYGIILKGILAGSEVLAEPLLPDFRIVVSELFGLTQQSVA